MWWTFVINATMGLIMMATFVFCIPSVDDALNDPTGYPFLYVFQLALPDSGTFFFTALLMVLMMVSNISYQASTARTTFAFARDKALPFSSWIGKVCMPNLASSPCLLTIVGRPQSLHTCECSPPECRHHHWSRGHLYRLT